MNCQFRIDRVFVDVSGSLETFFTKADKGFVFEHPSTPEKGVHCHGYMFQMPITIKRLRAKVKETFSLKNNDYESSDKCGKKRLPLDLSGAYAYGSRFGTLRPLWLKNIPLTVLEELRIYSQNIGTEIETARSSKASKVIELTQKPDSRVFYDICDAVLLEARETPGVYENRLCSVSHFGTEMTELKQTIVKPKVIYEILLKQLKKHRIMTEINQLTRFMTTILREDPSQGEFIREAVFNRIFPRA